MFSDRADAGRRLAEKLEAYRSERPIILAIPKGGIEVACEIARHLNAELSVLISRKLPFEDNPESGYGAVTEDGTVFLHEQLARLVSPESIERTVNRQKQEIQRRIALLRQGRPLPDLANRTVILVDDGVAVGSTMLASIEFCRQQNAAKVIIAVPVSSRRFFENIRSQVDDAIILETPALFRAVADAYANWYDVSDDQAVALLAQYKPDKSTLK